MKFVELKSIVQDKVVDDFLNGEEFKEIVKQEMAKYEKRLKNKFNIMIFNEEAMIEFLDMVYKGSIPQDIYYAVKYRLIGSIRVQESSEEPITVSISNVTAKCLYDVVDSLKIGIEDWRVKMRENIPVFLSSYREWIETKEGIYNYLLDSDIEFTKNGERI